ncbi:MAG: ATP-binding cassette domain-containing protein [Isosphaeraceae bacterium]
MRLLTGFPAAHRRLGEDRRDRRPGRPDRRRRAARYLPENGPLYPDMAPIDLLTFFGQARGMGGTPLRDRIDEVVELCSLGQVAYKPVNKLSKGYRQRVAMAQAILHDPEVLIMDEPTSGLDPNQIRGVRQLIRQLGKSKTILVSTHILQEVDPVADRVLFIHDGKIVFDGTPQEFAPDARGMEDRFHTLTAHAV